MSVQADVSAQADAGDGGSKSEDDANLRFVFQADFI